MTSPDAPTSAAAGGAPPPTPEGDARGAAPADTAGAGGSPQPPSVAGDGPTVGTRLSAAEIHANVRLAAEEELRRPVGQLAWSALGAGLTIGFSFVAAAYLAHLAPPHLQHAAAAAGYPLGFIFVVLARSQLFTENTLEPVIPLLADFTVATLLRVLRLWAVVLAVNLLGALLFALVVAFTPALEGALSGSLREVARVGTEGGFWRVAYQGVFGGWLVALMAWLVASTRATGAQIALIWLTTAPIAAFGFSHSIAGAVEAFYRVAVGDATALAMLGGFLVPAVLGNVVGGVTLVALLNHGQVGGSPRWPAPPPEPPMPPSVPVRGVDPVVRVR